MTVDSTASAESIRRLRGEALRAVRLAAGLKAIELAQRVNDRTRGSDITHHAIYSYERGKVLLSREVGQRIAAALNLYPGDILLGDPDFTPPGIAPGSAPGTDLGNNPEAHGVSPGISPGTSSPATPTSQTDTAPDAVLSPADRSTLKRLAWGLPDAAGVLVRLLRESMIGKSDVRGYLDLFHLVLRDAQILSSSREAQRLRARGRSEDADALYSVVESTQKLADLLNHALAELYPFDPARTAAHHQACLNLAAAADPLLHHLRDSLGQSNRGHRGED